MTKEELEKEAEEKAFSYAQLIPCSPYMEKRHREIDFKEGYFAGAEPREKRIAELEEKLKHAEENCINKTCVVLKDKEDCVAQLADLEKENAELKETVIKMNNVITETFSNLTKAKEIIKDLCGMVRELNKPNVQLTNVDYSLAEAEQFLNSEGK